MAPFIIGIGIVGFAVIIIALIAKASAFNVPSKWAQQSYQGGHTDPHVPEVGDYWGEHRDHPIEDWRFEIDNGDTRLGYWQWVDARIAYEKQIGEGGPSKNRFEEYPAA